LLIKFFILKIIPGGIMVEVNGTLVWYYMICKRELWLMSRNILPDQFDENIDFGRFLHEFTYKKSKKEIAFGNVKFDLIYEDNDKLVIGETKKSSKFFEASKMQLLFYLYYLNNSGINAEGVLHYPEERKKIKIFLDENSIKEMDFVIKDILEIINEDKPPEVVKINFCKNCGYNEYCFS
jgi:CRISPR-associated exonuclease Cas4